MDKDLLAVALVSTLREDVHSETEHIFEGVPETPMEYHKPQDGYHLPEGMVMRTHPQSRCVGNFCSVHNPSDHPLKDALREWRSDKGRMDRQCVHGVGHPDPDDLAHYRRTRGSELADGRGLHGCCIERCCATHVAVIDGEVVSERLEIEG